LSPLNSIIPKADQRLNPLFLHCDDSQFSFEEAAVLPYFNKSRESHRLFVVASSGQLRPNPLPHIPRVTSAGTGYRAKEFE